MLDTPLYANSVYLIGNSAVNAVLGFVFWILAARLYTTEDVGLGSAVIAAVGLLAFIASLGLGFGLIRFLPGSGDDARRLINGCLTLASLAAIAAATIFIVGTPLWSPALTFVRENTIFVGAFVVFVIVATLSPLLDGVFIGLRQAKYTLIKNLAQGLFKVVLIAALASVFKVFGIFASYGLGIAGCLGLALFLFLPRLQPGYRPRPILQKQVSNELVHFSLANYASSGLWTAPAWILPIMIVNLLGGEANAFFYISWSMAGLLFAIPLATSTSLFTEGSYDEKALPHNVSRSLKLMVVLLLPAIAVLLAAGDKILLLFGKEYSLEGTKLLWLLAPSALPVAVNVLYLGIARVKKRLKDIILVAATIAFGTLVLSYVLLPRLGILAAGVGWLASQSIVALVLTPRIRKLLRAEPNTESSTEGHKPI